MNLHKQRPEPVVTAYHGESSAGLETTCPACGQPMTVKLPLVDMNSRTVGFGPNRERCNGQLALQLIEIVVKNYPNVVHQERIATILWPDPDRSPTNVKYNIYVHTHKANQALRPLGFAIVSDYARGLKLIRTRVRTRISVGQTKS
jgi:hypothetical protein